LFLLIGYMRPSHGGPGPLTRVAAGIGGLFGSRGVRGPTLSQRVKHSQVGRSISEKAARPRVRRPSIFKRTITSVRNSELAESWRARRSTKDVRAKVQERRRQAERGIGPPPSKGPPEDD
jgi:hypothetical protein